MVKTLLKLALAAFIANAVWRIGLEYVTELKFKDAVREAAIYARGDNELRARIEGVGAQFDVPVDGDALTITRDERHVTVQGSYEKPIELLPGHAYAWQFDWAIDAEFVRPKPGVSDPAGETEGR
jgi:hypothetical protein